MSAPARGPIARPGSSAIPTLADVDVIGACPHPALRNLRITQAYHELSAAMAQRIGSGANWCTFATWASKQAGQSMHFIADLFRLHLETVSLFRPPFTPEQLRAIADGHMPDGRL